MANKIVLVGKAASGKDYLRKRLIDRGLSYGVSHTTRDPRPGEVHGKDYIYVTVPEFKQIVDAGNIIEYQIFNNWYYGITREQFAKADVMIMNAEAVEMLPEDIRKQCTVIYLDIPYEVRLNRLQSRSDQQDPLEGRMQLDEEQYANFTDYDIRITNPDF